ncbi:IF44L protein, partial [Amia calva]|nr:IF44L protein [Amia calva]
SRSMDSTPWREVSWTEERDLMEYISSFTPSSESIPRTRVLLLGPVGAGKSSFISSVNSAFSGQVTNWAMVGSTSGSFTKKLRSFNIRAEGGEPMALELCDIMGLGDGKSPGLSVQDAVSIIKGHVPEGHKFSPSEPITPDTPGFVKRPTVKDAVHCVAFVLDACKVESYGEDLAKTFSELWEEICDLGIHQVALLTHVDQACKQTAGDVSNMYRSRELQQTMEKAAWLLGMSVSYVVPVKNYSCQLALHSHTDTLLLNAVEHILSYAQLFFQDCQDPKAGLC